MNIVILAGRLGKDPETSYTQAGTACTKVSLATSEKFVDNSGQTREETEWHNLLIWGKRGEVVSKYLSKGSYVTIRGKLKTTHWMDDKINQKRYMTQIVVQDFEFGPKSGSGGGSGGGHGNSGGSGGRGGDYDAPVDGGGHRGGNNDSSSGPMDDDDIPF